MSYTTATTGRRAANAYAMIDSSDGRAGATASDPSTMLQQLQAMISKATGAIFLDKGVAIEKQNSEKELQGLNPSDTSVDFAFRTVGTGLYAITSLLFLILYLVLHKVSDFSYEIFYLTQSSDGPEMQVAFRYSPILAVSIAAFLFTIGGVLEFVTWRNYRLNGLRSRQNGIYWVIDSLAWPILMTTIGVTIAQFDMFSLLSYFALSHIGIVLCYVQEMSNKPYNSEETTYKGSNTGASWYSAWVGILLLIPIVVYLGHLGHAGDLPIAVWSIFSLYVVRGLSIWLSQMSYARFLNNPTSGMWPYSATESGKTNFMRYNTFTYILDSIFIMAIMYTILSLSWHDKDWLVAAVKNQTKTFAGCVGPIRAIPFA